jgi:HEAT repeat protein
MNIEELRRRLRNIHTRSAAINAAIDAGETVIDTLLVLLQDRNEGVRWSAIRILSEIGDDRAVGPLIALLEQSKNTIDVARALRAITGEEELGDDPQEWRSWARQDSRLRSSAGDGMLSDHELLEAATRDLPVTIKYGEAGVHLLKVSLPEERSQQLWIDFTRTDPDGQAIVQLSTPCGLADAARYESALKRNMSIPYGAIALGTLNDALHFVMVDSYLRRTAHPEDIAESITSLAAHGDAVERMLSEEDRY